MTESENYIGTILIQQDALTEEKLKVGLQMQESHKKLSVFRRIGEELVDNSFCKPGQVNEALQTKKNKLYENTTLGKILIEMGIITDEELEKTLTLHMDFLAPLGEILIDKGLCTQNDINKALKTQELIRSTMLRTLARSYFDPLNIMEVLVNSKVDELIRQYEGCDCIQCRADVVALSLNKLPIRYISNITSFLQQFERYQEEYSSQIQKTIVESICYVKEHPKLSCRKRAIGARPGIRGVVPVNVSNRHVHLSSKDLTSLFGKGYRLKKWKDLIQPGQFAAQETVILQGPKGSIERVRILGPTRSRTQVEISGTDQFILGIRVPVRESGKLHNTPGIKIKGPKGIIDIKEGVIRAFRHIHMSPDDGLQFGVTNGEHVNVRLKGDRTTICENVLIRITDTSALEMHIDTDEANAAGVPQSSEGEILV